VRRLPAVVGIIQARLGSSRLPAKILAPLAGRPLLALLAERLAGARVDEWWLATTRGPEDDVTAAWGEAIGLRVQRGERDDVLSRFTAIVRERRPDWIVRVTADDPFADAGLVNLLLGALGEAEKGAGWVGIAGASRLLPLGYGAELARAAELLASEREIPAAEPWHRTHVLSWLRSRSQPCLAPAPADWPARPGWRWTIDTPEDLAMARGAFALFGARAASLSYPEMVARLDAHPEVAGANLHVRQKAVEEG
jgi:spore coat polysaccharide biosynthesis protein SpsF